MADSQACGAALLAARSETVSAQAAVGNAQVRESNAGNDEDRNKLKEELERAKNILIDARSEENAAERACHVAENAERIANDKKVLEQQAAEEADKRKAEEAAKKSDESHDSTRVDKQPTETKKKDIKSGIDAYDRNSITAEDLAKQQALIKQVQELTVKSEKDSHETAEGKPVAVVAAAASAAPAIANTASAGTTQDGSTPTATTRIQGAAGSGGPST